MSRQQTEFQNLYKHLRKVWLSEVKSGFHGRTGFGNTLAFALNVAPVQISIAKHGKVNSRLTARQYLSLSRRFDVPVEELVRAACGT